jgi:hypothetical protein
VDAESISTTYLIVSSVLITLVEMTASEPLSLQQEYAMQKQWAADEDSKYCQFL